MYVTNDREMDKEGNNYVIGAFCAGLSLPPISMHCASAAII